VLMPSEVEALRAEMHRHIDRTLVSLMAYGGLRPGECLALRWSDVTRTHVSVSKALSLGEVKTTKTGKSRRVPLIGPLSSDLIQWRFANRSHAAEDLVFQNFQGQHWTEHDWRAWGHMRFKPALRAAGLDQRTRAYDLRHTNASLLLASGLDVIHVAKRLGHSPAMCLSTYAHVIDGLDGRTRIDLEAEIARVRGAARAAS
jgi:integrase